MGNARINVMLAVQGQAAKVYQLGSGATVKSALTAAKLNSGTLSGAVTVNNNRAELNQRLKANDFIQVTPKVEGGVR